MSPDVFGSFVQYTSRSPDQLMGIVGRSDSSTSSSERVLSATLTYRPHLPFRREPKARRRPSGDQIGIALSCEASNVNFDGVGLPASKIQTSPPSGSCRWTAVRLPSGDTSTPVQAVAAPASWTLVPERLNQSSGTPPMSAGLAPLRVDGGGGSLRYSITPVWAAANA